MFHRRIKFLTCLRTIAIILFHIFQADVMISPNSVHVSCRFKPYFVQFVYKRRCSEPTPHMFDENSEDIVLLNQLFSENALDSWTNDTLQKMRKVLTGLLIDMSKLPGSIEDFENIFVQLELIHEKNLFEGVYKEEMKRLRSEFEEVKGVFEIRDFVLESENNKTLKNLGSSEELLKKFKQKTRNFLHSALKDFYSP